MEKLAGDVEILDCPHRLASGTAVRPNLFSPRAELPRVLAGAMAAPRFGEGRSDGWAV